MRAELVIGTATQMAAWVAMQATDGPDLLTKFIAITAGCSLGALVASMLSDRASAAQRARRFITSFAAGIAISLIALWIWPSRAGIDPREWVVVIAFGAAFAGWHLVRRLDDRVRTGADAVVDHAAERLGIPPTRKEPQE